MVTTVGSSTRNVSQVYREAHIRVKGWRDTMDGRALLVSGYGIHLNEC